MSNHDDEKKHYIECAVNCVKDIITDSDSSEDKFNWLMKFIILPEWNKFSERFVELLQLLGNNQLVHSDYDVSIWVKDGQIFYRDSNFGTETHMQIIKDCGGNDYCGIYLDGLKTKFPIATYWDNSREKSKNRVIVNVLELEKICFEEFFYLRRFLQAMDQAYNMLKNLPVEGYLAEKYSTWGEMIQEFGPYEEHEDD